MKNLIAIDKESIDKNELLRAKPENQKPANNKNEEKAFKIDSRAFDFINSFLTDDEFNEFEKIFHKPKLQSHGKILNSIAILELNLEKTINHLDLKKDALNKANTLDLEKIKNSLKQLFSIRKFFSTSIKQILLDYQKNTNSIKTEDSKLEEYLDTILNQFNEKNKEVGNLKNTILSIPIPTL
ncbi:blasticidin-S acetyltransferase [Borreliella burgdorferi]|nr:blasticidin-S acetyltransferase [Borreliella burgdorferi]PRQ97493.1 blasticidin-S acetyltransferase [Borreliella burgdorferi]PRR24415.1 blasticidin-S acetyltransferase [Borreliella burgdorferi]PRR38098.1 blasticidin-S acetyltransferase [Borreliella burgdorferi]PRR53209.1 blasticidin-S acetyltransferase [Borreliella burgdorferi]